MLMQADVARGDSVEGPEELLVGDALLALVGRALTLGQLHEQVAVVLGGLGEAVAQVPAVYFVQHGLLPANEIRLLLQGRHRPQIALHEWLSKRQLFPFDLFLAIQHEHLLRHQQMLLSSIPRHSHGLMREQALRYFLRMVHNAFQQRIIIFGHVVY